MLVEGQYNSVSKEKKNMVKCLLNEEKNDASSAILHNNSTIKNLCHFHSADTADPQTKT